MQKPKQISHVKPASNQVRIKDLNGDNQYFIIEYTGGSQETKIVDIRIALDEDDMSDFVFTLALSDCNAAGTPTYILQDTEWNSSNIIF